MGIHTRFPLKKKEKEDISRKVTSSTKPLDPMAYEMELNRIDFKNDVSSILDQIEKDFEINSVANIGEGLAPSAGNVELSSLNLLSQVNHSKAGLAKFFSPFFLFKLL